LTPLFRELKDLGEANKKMKRVWRTRDKFGGSFEVYVLDRNNEIAEDLIYVRMKREKEKEIGFCIQPWEARNLIAGLFLAIDEIIEQYKLEKFKIKSRNLIKS